MLRRLLPVAAAAAVIALPASAPAASPVATAAKNCPDKTNFAGTQYVVNVKTRGVSCGKAFKLIKAYHRAGAGNRKVNRFKCTQRINNKGVTSFDATVHCTKGGKKVSHLYQKSR